MRPRPPDWLMYLGVTAALFGAALLTQLTGGPPAGDKATPPKAPARAPARPSQFEPTITVAAPATASPGTGTAFSVSSGGIWFTARHVVEGCRRTAVVVAPGQGVAAEVRLDPRGETAVLVTQGGAPALPLAPGRPLRPGAVAFHPGFPSGRPGEVVSKLIGRETLVMRGRHGRRETVLAWEQTDGAGVLSRSSLAGLSGAPALDAQGRVIGVTIAQSRRQGQVYTTTPWALRAALARAHIEPATGAEPAPVSPRSYRRIAADLRDDLSVVPVVCLGA